MLDIAVNRKSYSKEKHICVFQFPHHTHITQITHARFSVEETRKSPPLQPHLPTSTPRRLEPAILWGCGREAVKVAGRRRTRGQSSRGEINTNHSTGGSIYGSIHALCERSSAGSIRTVNPHLHGPLSAYRILNSKI